MVNRLLTSFFDLCGFDCRGLRLDIALLRKERLHITVVDSNHSQGGLKDPAVRPPLVRMPPDLR